MKEFRTELLGAMEHLKVPRELAQRYLNDGFSGGEKKRVEILQMAMLKPRIAILDETDSGLDIDALRIVAEGVNTLVGPDMGALVITHYQRILNYVTPDHVHVFVDGRIVASGGAELAHKLEAEGYEAFTPAGVARGRQCMSQSETETIRDIRADYGYGWHVDDVSTIYKAPKGLTHELIDVISDHKSEPDWMREVPPPVARLLPRAAHAGLGRRPLGDRLRQHPLLREADREAGGQVGGPPAEILDTWDRLGIPEAEKKYLAGVGAQYESEVVYHKLQADLESKGVIFLDMDSGLREHEELVKQYFATIIPQNDNKFAALNSAVWSGGSFIYVPPGVSIEMPLQAYFRINAENMGQFERTLIIVDEGAYVHYVEGCTAPIYSSDSLHSAVVEIVVKKGGRCRYTTIQNWSNNVYNLVTKRAVAYENATMEWVDGNLGSKVTMKYPRSG